MLQQLVTSIDSCVKRCVVRGGVVGVVRVCVVRGAWCVVRGARCVVAWWRGGVVAWWRGGVVAWYVCAYA
jgi:hypothetical protein